MPWRRRSVVSSSGDLTGELTGGREDQRGGSGPSDAIRSTIGIPNASVLPEPVGDLDEHVATGEHVPDHHSWIGNGADAARAERVDGGARHAELGKDCFDMDSLLRRR